MKYLDRPNSIWSLTKAVQVFVPYSRPMYCYDSLNAGTSVQKIWTDCGASGSLIIAKNLLDDLGGRTDPCESPSEEYFSMAQRQDCGA